MRKIGRSRVEEQTAAKQWHLPLGRMAEESLWDAVVLSGVEFALEQPEAERTMLCGPRYVHLAERAALRAGHAKSSLSLGGRRAELERPRVRSKEGHELGKPLPSGRCHCFAAVCSSALLLPASSSYSHPILRSREDCRHFNFNTLQDIAQANFAARLFPCQRHVWAF